MLGTFTDRLALGWAVQPLQLTPGKSDITAAMSRRHTWVLPVPAAPTSSVIWPGAQPPPSRLSSLQRGSGAL